MVKKLITLFIIILSFIFVLNINVYADSNFTIKKVNETATLDGGISYIDEDISFNRYNKTGTFEGNFKAMTLNGSNKQVKIATWSAENSSKYATTNVTLDKIAEDYEANHPGWMVIGGVNSEGWWSGVAPYTEISNTYVQDYKQVRTSVSGESFKELIGFREDNTHFIKRVPEYSDNMKAWIYDDNHNELAKLDVVKVNELPTGDELSVIDLKNTKNFDLSSYYVVKGNYELYRPKTIDMAGATSLTDTADGILIEGTLTTDNVTSVQAMDYHFYYVTKSETIYNQIKQGTNTICQYEFLDEFKEACSVTGYMFKIIEKSHVMNADDYQDNSPYGDSFYYRQHDYVTGEFKNRSCIGFKDDGSIVLAISYNGSQGPSCYSLGNVLLSMGVTNAYQFDGGGSVTMIRRTENGKFEFLNPGAYGNHTSVTTGIFFVCEKDDITVSEINKQSVTFTNNNEDNNNVVINCNNKTYKMEDNKVTVTDLSPATTYNYSITYDSKYYLDKNVSVKNCQTGIRSFTTKDFEAPWISLNFSNITKSTALVEINNDKLTNMTLFVGEEEFSLEDGCTSYTVNYLEPETEYKAYLKYTIIDTDTGKEYKFQTGEFDLKTTKYDTPVIKSFTFRKDYSGSLAFDYEIVDKDKRIESITLIYDTCADTLEGLIGSCKTEKIEQTTDIYLEIEYKDDTNNIKTIKTDAYHYEVEAVEEPTKGCSKQANISILIILVFISANLLYIFKKNY